MVKTLTQTYQNAEGISEERPAQLAKIAIFDMCLACYAQGEIGEALEKKARNALNERTAPTFINYDDLAVYVSDFRYTPRKTRNIIF